jgi:hypothetical protein
LQQQQEEKLLQQLLVSLQQLGYLPSGAEGLQMWAVQVQKYSDTMQHHYNAEQQGNLKLLLSNVFGRFDSSSSPDGRRQELSSMLLQNLSAALWGLICHVQWKGGL